jgi:flagellar basal body-associated protein FliL
MNEVLTIRIKKKTFWILLVVFLLIISACLFWFVTRKAGKQQRAEKGKKEIEELMKKMKEKYRKFHIEHTVDNIIYKEECEVCRGFWRD